MDFSSYLTYTQSERVGPVPSEYIDQNSFAGLNRRNVCHDSGSFESFWAMKRVISIPLSVPASTPIFCTVYVPISHVRQSISIEAH